MKGKFIKSALVKADYPKWRLSEVAFVGRSNVGKSSLINDLLQEKGLAKTSSIPGKTQLINFFSIDDKFAFVDLPGYGFAKVPDKIKATWGTAIDTYLNERENLHILLLLLDIRREPSVDDQAFVEWATFKKRRTLIVLTKCDKVSTNERQSQTARYKKAFPGIDYLHYSIKDPKSRLALLHYLDL
jgi:GTP-binding protein